MRSVKKILWSCAVLAVVCGCTKLETPPNKNQPSGDGTGVYKVVAHRGGYQECARPDCSISSLKYAIMLRCFASECDIVLTGDNDVLVAHPQSGYLVNGLEPFDHTVAEIRAAGTLANGEPVPTLRDFIRVLQDPELNPHGMRLWLDVKRLTKNGEEIDVNHSINACYRACEIIKEMKAQSLCEFLIPTGGSIFDVVRDKVIDEYRINLAWMTCTHPDNYGKAWAQLSYDKIFGDNTAYGPMDYISAGVPLSVYNVDDDETMDAVIPYYPKLKAIFTNYPSKLIQKLRAQGYADLRPPFRRRTAADAAAEPTGGTDAPALSASRPADGRIRKAAAQNEFLFNLLFSGSNTRPPPQPTHRRRRRGIFCA